MEPGLPWQVQWVKGPVDLVLGWGGKSVKQKPDYTGLRKKHIERKLG